jgi:hypothetical protein
MAIIPFSFLFIMKESWGRCIHVCSSADHKSENVNSIFHQHHPSCLIFFLLSFCKQKEEKRRPMILSSYLPIFLIVDHPTLLMFVQKLSSRSSILNAEDHLVFGPVWQSIVEYLINFQKLNFTLIFLLFLYLTKVEILISKLIEVQD